MRISRLTPTVHDPRSTDGYVASVPRAGNVSWRPVAFLVADLAGFALAAGAAFSISLVLEREPFGRTYGRTMRFGIAWHGWAVLLVLVCLLAYFGGRRHYTARIPFWIEAGTVLRATSLAFVADGLISVAVYRTPFGYEGMFRWILFFPAALAMRQAARLMLGAYGCWGLRTLVVGDPATVATVNAALRSEPALGYELVGSLSPREAPRGDDVAGWMRLLAAQRVQLVVVLLGDGSCPETRIIASMLTRARVPLAFVPVIDGLPVQGLSPQYFLSHDVLMLAGHDNLDRPVSRLAKSVFDQVGAAVLLFLLAPLFVVLASLVRADGSPAFYRHKRVGAGGRSFECLKFRTMVPDADAALRKLLASSPEAQREWNETQKLRDDPRITPIGRFLRATSLDELPQLVNVLLGEMSLVGPRPIVEAEIPRYGRDIEYYYDMKPGMTGLWQVSGRSNTSYSRRVQLDRWYARNWTLWHDVAILLKTIRVVCGRDGAV